MGFGRLLNRDERVTGGPALDNSVYNGHNHPTILPVQYTFHICIKITHIYRHYTRQPVLAGSPVKN